MLKYNERLEQLSQQMARKNRLQSLVKELRSQKEELTTKVMMLEGEFRKEQIDVDKLEGRSLAAFYYSVLGKKDTMLNKERQEAYGARVKYDAAALELDTVEMELEKAEAELKELRWVEQDYQQILQEKEKAIRTAGGENAREIILLEEKLGQLESFKKELQEAIDAGKKARTLAERILSDLNSAEGWGTWDLLGGGLISDLAKHDRLDSAQSYVEALQVQLRKFKTELTDVQISADMQVNIEGFLRFADYFFDDIFSSWAILDQIKKSQGQVEQVRAKINQIISRLEEMMNAAVGEQNIAKHERNNLVLRVQ